MEQSVAMGQSWSRLGFALARLDVEAAMAAKQNAYEVFASLLPENDPQIGHSLAELGNLMRLNGDHAGAIETRERALAIAKQHHLEMKPSFIKARCNIALDRASLGQFDDAMQSHRQCLEMKRIRLGDDHPEVVSTLNNIGILAISLGDLDTAEPAMTDAYQLALEIFPRGAITALGTRINYAVMLWHSGQPVEARNILEGVVADMEASLGVGNPATNRGRSILARVVLELGQARTADQLMSQSLAGLTPYWNADALLWAAEIALALGRTTEAANLADESFKLRSSLPEFTPWQVAEALLIRSLATGDEKAASSAREQFASLPQRHFRQRIGNHAIP